MAPLVIAHRGDSDRRPENTPAAFTLALDVGAPVIELDVRLTRDGHAVVIHDPTVDRTTDGHGAVADLTLSEVRRLSAGYPQRFGADYADERIPTLDEALSLAAGRARVLIELKTDGVATGAATLVETTASILEQAGLTHDVGFVSFDPEALEACRHRLPQVPRGLLVFKGECQTSMPLAASLGCNLVLPERSLVDDRWVEAAREAGVGLATWVVDEIDEYDTAARQGLVGVGTNRPSILLEHQRALAGAD